jgi:alpha-1,4-digalacturonate transport system permease protein
MDKASEWQIYWRIILPLTAPALAVLAIFSVVWRWNDFLWPLVVLSSKEVYTLQVGLNTYAGELNVQWHYILAMTVVTMIPVVLVFVFLQRFITSGIAGSGLK